MPILSKKALIYFKKCLLADDGEILKTGYSFKVDIYEANIVCLFVEKVKNGAAYVYFDKITCDYVFVFDTGITFKASVHESAHLTFFIMKNIGSVDPSNNQEPFCYLLEYIWGEIKTLLENKRRSWKLGSLDRVPPSTR